MFQIFTGSKEVYEKGAGGIIRFLLNIFCLTTPKHFGGEPVSATITSSVGKIYAWEGYVTVLCRVFLSHSTEENRR